MWTNLRAVVYKVKFFVGIVNFCRMTRMTSDGNSLELRTHEVGTYFQLLKEEFKDHDVKGRKKSLAEDAAKNRGRLTLDSKGVQFLRKRQDNIGDECSPRYYRYSMTEADDVLYAKQKSEELWKNTPSPKEVASFKRHSVSSPGDTGSSQLGAVSADELRDFANNNVGQTSELSCRHLEAALNQGKVNSLSEQTRKQRRKYFEKERKGSR